MRSYLFALKMVCFFTIGIAAPCFSEPIKTQDNPVYVLDTVTVTATKADQQLKDVPTNMVILTKTDIEACQPTDVMDLLRQVPGLVLSGMGSSKSSFYAGARGIQPSSRGMLIMLDGVEMNDPSNYLSVSSIPIHRIERIEIVKSPISALYGPSAVGGVIHIITRKPTTANETDANLTYGSNNRKEVELNSAGLLSSGFSYGLDYRYLDTDGYRDNSFRRHHGFTPRLGYHTEQVGFSLFSNIMDAEYGFPGGLPLDTYQDNPEQSLQPDCEGNSVTTATGMTMDWAIGRQSELKAKATYRTNDWETEDYGFLFKGEDYHTLTADASLVRQSSIGDIENRLLLGMEYRLLHNQPSMYMDDNLGGALLSQAKIEETLWGAFIQDELRPTQRLMINLGARYDNIQTDFKNRLDSSADYDNSHGKWSPRLGISYLFSTALNGFANYAEGIRSVNLARPAFRLTETVDPEKESSFELGMRGTIDDHLKYSLAGFWVTTQDKIIQRSRYDYANAGEARSRGLEAELRIDFFAGLYATVNYTYLDAEFTDYQTATADYNGNRVPLVPRHMGGASLGWRDERWGHISGAVRYVAETYIDDANTLELDDYTVVDMKYSYTFKSLFAGKDQLNLSVAVNNLLDETYAEYGEADGGMYVSGPVAFPADGRAFFVGLGYLF